MDASYTIRADRTKNRLYVILKGFFTEEQSHEALQTTLAELKKMKPGFSVITDISEFKPATQEVLERMQNGQKAIAASGVQRIVRVVDRKFITGQLQFLRQGKQIYQGQQEVVMAPSLEEAERLLDEVAVEA